MELDNRDFMQRDFQTIATTSKTDEYGKHLAIKKSRSVSISYKLNKRGKKMVDVGRDLEALEALLAVNSKVGFKVYKYLRANRSRLSMLTKFKSTEPVSIAYLSKRLECDRVVVSKCVSALVNTNVLKKDKRTIYINPDIYVPLVNDFELRCLLDWYDEGFVKSLDDYRTELQALLQIAMDSAKSELDFSKNEIDKMLVNTKNLIKE